jgi:LysM repeat protein
MKRIILLITLTFFLGLQHNFAQNPKKYTTYVVKSGETLKSIAKKVGCKVKEIKSLNPDISRTPKVNTTLVIPNKNFGKVTVIKHHKPTEKVTVHLVQQGDTFFGIAKKYNVTIQSIKDANPAVVTDGLHPGQKIRIPNKSEFTIQPETGKVVFYKVQKGDTKWHIATMHKITVAELEKMNPEMEGELKENDNIWVPAPEEVPEEIKKTFQQEQDTIHIYHLVKQGEGLFRIAVMYSTTQDKIKELNPEATKKLRPGMLLKIPGKKKNKFLVHEVVKGDTFFSLTHKYDISKKELLKLNPELTDGLKVGMIIKIKEIPKVDKNMMVDSIVPDKPIYLSFMMPLMTDTQIDLNARNNATRLRNICTDFYMGALLAIDTLQKRGLNINYHVYDTKNDLTHIYQLIQDEDLKNSDAIIGPFFFENAQKTARELPDMPVITPLFSKKQNNNHQENLIKAINDKERLLIGLKEYLKAHYKKQKIIITTDGQKDNIEKGKLIGNYFKSLDSLSNLQFIAPSHNKKHPEDIYMDKKELEESVTEGKDIWVILLSDTRVITSDIVNTYGVIANDHNIRLFTAKEFDDTDYLDYHYLSELDWTFPSIQFKLLNDKGVRVFREKYQKTNHAIPSKFAFQGYDITYDVLMRLSGYSTIIAGLEAGKSNRLAQQFDYKKSAKGDYRNNGILIIHFDKDLNFKLVE